jgi:hypothetical protein
MALIVIFFNEISHVNNLRCNCEVFGIRLHNYPLLLLLLLLLLLWLYEWGEEECI